MLVTALLWDLLHSRMQMEGAASMRRVGSQINPRSLLKLLLTSGASITSACLPSARASHKAKLDGKWVVNIILFIGRATNSSREQ